MSDLKSVLEAKSLFASYGKKQVLGGLDLTLSGGKFICLCGPNGCGKSTLISLLAGIHSEYLKYRGQIIIDSKDIGKFKRKELARKIAFMPQSESSPWNYQVKDVILSGRFAHTGFSGIYHQRDYQIAEDVAEIMGINHLKERFVFSLSGGEFQRVRIARSLAQQAEILLLDEPAANLDFTHRFDLLKLVKKLVQEKNIAVLVSIHDLNMAAVFADEMFLLSHFAEGQLQMQSGEPKNIMQPEILQRTYGKKFSLFQHPLYNVPQVYL